MGKYHHPKKRPADNYVPPYSAEVLATQIETLNLSLETLEILKKGGVNTVGDIAKRRIGDMFKVQNFNKKRLLEVRNVITPLGVTFRPDEQRDVNRENPNVNSNAQGGQQKGKKPNENKTQNGNNPANNSQKRNQDANKNAVKDNNRGGQNQPQQNNNQQNNAQKKGKKENNAVDFSKIFPREPLVHSAKILLEKDRFQKFQRAGKWGFKDEHGKEVIPPIYTEALSFKEDMAAVEVNGLFGFINRENELVIPYKYDCAGSFSEGWANVVLGEKSGYIDKTGKEMVPFIYDAATAFTGEGYARVKKDGRWGNITKDGQVSWQ